MEIFRNNTVLIFSETINLDELLLLSTPLYGNLDDLNQIPAFA